MHRINHPFASELRDLQEGGHDLAVLLRAAPSDRTVSGSCDVQACGPGAVSH